MRSISNNFFKHSCPFFHGIAHFLFETAICIVISRKVLEENVLTKCFTEGSAVRYSLETLRNDTIAPYQNLFEHE